ncbi:MAG: SatD family protein [Beutenbergiaceae bacterium]|uniref:SatD family protein n=1 Tax=Microbacterium sp. TaxID=51671 RepID=UPI003A84258C
MVAVVIADIVGSRELPDRAFAQAEVEAALARVSSALPGAPFPLHPVVGDEFQGIYPGLAAALAATLLLRLTLPEGLDCRFGIGVGDIADIPSRGGALSEGPAWWAARTAIEDVKAFARRSMPDARTAIAAPDDAPPAVAESVRLAAAAAYVRDGLIAQLGERARRLAFGRCLGATQRELAAGEGITQSAVSQMLSGSGAHAIVASFRALTA